MRGLKGQKRLKEWNVVANELYKAQKDIGRFNNANEEVDVVRVFSEESRLNAIRTLDGRLAIMVRRV